MALVVLMERCNFVSAGAETVDCTEATGHFTVWTIYQGVPHLYHLSERRGQRLRSQTVSLTIGGSCY